MRASAAAPDRPPGLRTPSLRRRVTLVVLVLLTGLLLVLGLVLDRVLADRLDSQLRDRLVDRATFARDLAGDLDAEQLAERLDGDGIGVRVVGEDGEVGTAGPVPGGDGTDDLPDGGLPNEQRPGDDARPDPDDAPLPAPGPPGPAGDDGVAESGSFLVLEETLDDGVRLTLYADRGSVDQTLAQVRVALLVSALLVLLVAAFALGPVVGRALGPLRQMTGVAQAITAGDRGRRLRPDRPATELGSTATAFDDMLDALEGAEAQARASESRLRDFVSDAAHELRTPVTGIRATGEHLLREDPDRGERERLLLALVREADRAGRLVDDLLLMARIDRGLDLHLAPVDLRALAEQVCDPRRLQHPASALEVEGRATVVGDADRLAQVVGNLVDNSLQAGARRVVLRVASGTGVGFDVVDDGAGIAPSDRERVFDRLVRLDESRSARRGGAGLGLPIARGIARAHDGDLIFLDPVDGVGAHARLTLPGPADPG